MDETHRGSGGALKSVLFASNISEVLERPCVECQADIKNATGKQYIKLLY